VAPLAVPRQPHLAQAATMAAGSVSFVEILRRQFDPTFKMLTELIEACPKAVWVCQLDANPFWQQITNVLAGIQFWFREAQETCIRPKLGHGPVSDLGNHSTYSVPKDKVREYQAMARIRGVEPYRAKESLGKGDGE